MLSKRGINVFKKSCCKKVTVILKSTRHLQLSFCTITFCTITFCTISMSILRFYLKNRKFTQICSFLMPNRFSECPTTLTDLPVILFFPSHKDRLNWSYISFEIRYTYRRPIEINRLGYTN